MPEKSKNIFGHPTVAKPNMPTNERLSQMVDMLRNNPDAELDLPVEEEQQSVGDLEQLVFLGRIEDTKIINGFTFDMQTLTGKEQNDVWMSVSFLNNDTKFFLIKVAFLARSITAVNGRDLDVLYKGKNFRDLTKEQRCINVVEAWQQPLIDELYNFYSEMLERSRRMVTPDNIKK